MVYKSVQSLIEKFIKRFIEYSPYLVILSVIVLIIGGFLIFLLEDGHLGFVDAYWINIYAFFGNEPPNLSNPLSKLFMLFTSFLGLIVLPAVVSIIIDSYQKRLELEEELKTRVKIIILRHSHMDDSEAEKRAKMWINSLKEEIKKLKN